eukprot:COSAG02_NODE_97_length_37159_cov_37.660335_38_plen_51_part_00
MQIENAGVTYLQSNVLRLHSIDAQTTRLLGGLAIVSALNSEDEGSEFPTL